MKLKRENYDNIGSAPLMESSLEIGDHGFILGLVMKDMYSYPIRAICREIASNCRDAHREMGTPDRRIRVTAPSRFANEIRFKDWGPGISPNRMDVVYTKLGRSTKRDSNDETGGFGLGAKTPFAYASQFSVISISKIETQHDVDVLNLDTTDVKYTLEDVKGRHMMCVYNASRGDSTGATGGAVQLLSAELTEEETGTEVVIGVKGDDIETFKSELIYSTKYWDCRPDIIGDMSRHPWPEEPEVVISGTKWRMIKLNYYRSGEHEAIIDGIVYPLSLDEAVRSKSATPELRALYDKIKRANIQLFYNTGDIELVPNREAILYDEKTVDVLTKTLEVLSREIQENVEKKIESCETYLEAQKFCKTFASSIMDPGFPEWKGNTVYHKEGYGGIQLNLIKKDVGIIDGAAVARVDTYTNNGSGQKPSRTHKANFNFENILIINDVGKMVPRINVEKFMQDEKSNWNNKFQILVALDGDIDSLICRIKKEFNIDLRMLDVKYLSDYDPPKGKSVRAKVQRGTSLVQEFILNTCGSYMWEETRVSREDDTGVYVILGDRRTTIYESLDAKRTLSNQQLSTLLGYLDMKGKTLYGVTEKVAEKLGDGFVPLGDLVKKARRKFAMQQTELDKLMGYDFALKRYREKYAMSLLNSIDAHSSEIKKLKDMIAFLKNETENLAEIKSKIRLLDVPLEVQKDPQDLVVPDLNQMQADIVDKYPLLEIIDSYCMRRNDEKANEIKEHLKKYVEMISAETEEAQRKAS